MKKTSQKGITLIALIVSIIVMLILVEVTITLVYEGGVINKAGDAKDLTKAKADEETNMVNEAGERISEAVAAGQAVEIKSKEELIAFRDGINSGQIVVQEGTVFKLTENIDLTGEDWIPIGMVVEVEGEVSTQYAFQGIFDGNGKTITGLNVPSSFHGGLFGIAMNSEIKNLTISNSTIVGTQIGAFVGGIINIKITNCNSVNNTITANESVEGEEDSCAGGIAGILVGKNEITNCNNSSTVISDGYSGGIAGISGDYSFPGTGNNILNCTNSGNITGKVAGGITSVVHNEEPATEIYKIENCTNSGTITGEVSTGICAITMEPAGRIVNCSNSGTIAGNGIKRDLYYFEGEAV